MSEATCIPCGEPLTIVDVPTALPDGTVLNQRIAFDRGNLPHAERCPDNPFAREGDHVAARALARSVQRDMAARR